MAAEKKFYLTVGTKVTRARTTNRGKELLVENLDEKKKKRVSRIRICEDKILRMKILGGNSIEVTCATV